MRANKTLAPLLMALLIQPCFAVSFVDSQGALTKSGAGAIGAAYSQFLPDGWTLRFTDATIAGKKISWSSANQWTVVLDQFARSEKLYLLADGATKVIIAAPGTTVNQPGLTLFNAQSPIASDYPWQKMQSQANSVKQSDIQRVVAASAVSVTHSVSPEPSSGINSPVAAGGEAPPSFKPITTPAKSDVFKPIPEPSKPVLTAATAPMATSLVPSNIKTQPKVVTLQSGLERPDFDYLVLVGGQTDRFDVRDGKLFFKVKKGSLESNIETLLAKTSNTRILYLASPNHEMPNDFWVSAPSVLGILDQIVQPFNVPHPIKWAAYQNNMVVINYGG